MFSFCCAVTTVRHRVDHDDDVIYFIFQIPKTKAAGQPVVVNHARRPTQLIVRHDHYIITRVSRIHTRSVH